MYVACSERETSFWYQLFKSTPDGDKVIVVGATARVTKSQLKSVSLFIVVYVICCRTLTELQYTSFVVGWAEWGEEKKLNVNKQQQKKEHILNGRTGM